MPISLIRCVFLSCLVLLLGIGAGCTHYQPTKNVWKGTKGLWYEYVSPPASIDYGDKGEISERGQKLADGMMGIDVQLSKLERIMLNADKPPTKGWMNDLFASVPWIDGFAGVKSDGKLLGQETRPGTHEKELDFNPILYEDAKQNTRALRCDVQQTSSGPEVVVATPLYDGVDFLGAVAVYFDMSSLLKFAKPSENVVILTPQALLCPGKYDFASTPLAGADWKTIVSKSSAGTISNASGTFAYQVRYLGNLPIIFCVVDAGSFPPGSGNAAQGLAFFPKREKLSPPPQKPRTKKGSGTDQSFVPSEQQETAPTTNVPSGTAVGEHSRGAVSDIAPGSRESVLLHQNGRRLTHQHKVGERQIEGENVQYRPRRRTLPPIALPEEPSPEPMPAIKVPSPFGPRHTAGAKSTEESGNSDKKSLVSQPTEQGQPKATPDKKVEPSVLPGGRPSPFGPHPTSDKDVKASEDKSNVDGEKSTDKPATDKKSAVEKKEEDSSPATLPGGRPSPFGPKQ